MGARKKGGERVKKYYKKNIISIVILLCIVLILYFTPPIMLADGWIEFGSRADSFETHMLNEYNLSLIHI